MIPLVRGVACHCWGVFYHQGSVMSTAGNVLPACTCGKRTRTQNTPTYPMISYDIPLGFPWESNYDWFEIRKDFHVGFVR